MLEKPDLADEKFIAELKAGYGIPVSRVEFLPIGNDATAWAYRIQSAHGIAYFLKVKKGQVAPASVLVPRYLFEQGIAQVVAPLRPGGIDLWPTLEGFALLLYPFIEGRVGMDVGLSESQWIELGATLQKIHSCQLPAELAAQVPVETFNPKWANKVRELQTIISNRGFADLFEQELAEYWKSKRDEIARLVDRTEELGRMLQDKALPNVLCHTDIHTANVLINSAGRLHIVDWDTPLLAPKERDLMFVVGNQREDWFFRGYGNTEIDSLAIAYYRYEWVVQELGDYGERVFGAGHVGKETKQDAVRGFRQLFSPGDVVDEAYTADSEIK